AADALRHGAAAPELTAIGAAAALGLGVFALSAGLLFFLGGPLAHSLTAWCVAGERGRLSALAAQDQTMSTRERRSWYAARSIASCFEYFDAPVTFALATVLALESAVIALAGPVTFSDPPAHLLSAGAVLALIAVHGAIATAASMRRTNAFARFTGVGRAASAAYVLALTVALSVLALSIVRILWADVEGLGLYDLNPGPGPVFCAGLAVLAALASRVVAHALSDNASTTVSAILNGLFLFAIGVAVLDRLILAPLDAIRTPGGAGPGAMMALAIGAGLMLTGLWWSARWLRNIAQGDHWRVPGGVLLLALFASGLGENHHVGTIRSDTETAPLSAKEHAKAWLAERGGRPGQPIPVVFVLAEGGGIRAGAFTAQMLAELDAQSGGAFFPHVYAMAGVSGGSVGLATHLASIAADADQTPDRARCVTDEAITADHLTALFTGLLAIDVPAAALPVEAPGRIRRAVAGDPAPEHAPHGRGFVDRGDLFDMSLEEAWRAAAATCAAEGAGGLFAQSLEQVAGEAARARSDRAVPPIVLFAATRANDGRVAAASNARFADCAGDVEGLETIGGCLPETRTLALSTAAHISARFPYSNPPAVVDGRGEDGRWERRRYVDGAYYDNSGAAAAHHALDDLFAAADELGVARERLHIIVLNIHAAFFSSDATHGGLKPMPDLFAQLRTPPAAAFAARGTRGRHALVSFCRLTARDPSEAQLCETLHQARLDSDAPDVATAAAFATTDAGTPGTASGPPNLSWINAPLAVTSDVGHPRNIPLGWLITDAAHETIKSEAARLADPIWGCVCALTTARGRAAISACRDDGEDRAPQACARSEPVVRRGL
ncbi:MAG: hypothetical protein MI723_14210, partial [Caulobacterales bacterium]|nr:hypothetical protein [Caulobacterales bacterium]